jgi:hypothetical protein
MHYILLEIDTNPHAERLADLVRDLLETDMANEVNGIRTADVTHYVHGSELRSDGVSAPLLDLQ